MNHLDICPICNSTAITTDGAGKCRCEACGSTFPDEAGSCEIRETAASYLEKLEKLQRLRMRRMDDIDTAEIEALIERLNALSDTETRFGRHGIAEDIDAAAALIRKLIEARTWRPIGTALPNKV